MNLKLRTLLLIAILLISGNACLAQTQTPLPGAHSILPVQRHKCLDLLELERIEVDPRTNTISGEHRLAADYKNVLGWFQGFFTAVNLFDQSDGNVTKETTSYQWITWTFCYC